MGKDEKILVEFKNVTKSFSKITVLKKVSMKFYKGETHVICGKSGAGKSTLIRCINYLEPIDKGTIKFNGMEVNRHTAREVCKRVGIVFQAFNLFPHLTSLENVILGPCKVLKQPKKLAILKAKELFEKVGLIEKINSYPRDLSGGQKQRVGIIRALAMEPELMLFDEPTSALDPEMIKEVLEVMKGLAATGMSMIVITHEMGFAKEAAHRISLFDNGTFVETKPPEQFFKNPEHEATKNFLNQILNI